MISLWFSTVSVRNGHLDQAESTFKLSGESVARRYGVDSPEYATALYDLGECCAKRKHFLDAELHMKVALRIRERVYGPLHTLTANICNGLALVYIDQGRRDDALELQRRAREAFDQV